MNTIRTSPWWYRKRALVFGLIYLAGFWAPAVYDALTQTRYISVLHVLRIEPAAAVLVAACWALRVWGASYLTSATVWSANSVNGTLVTGGPFAYSRNPLYFGNVLMALGIGAFAPAYGWVFINLANMVFVVMLIRWEERGMRERYARAFDEYCMNVPQLFPRLTPGTSSGARPLLREGLRAEIFTGALLAGTIAIVVSPLYGWAVFAALYVAGITTQSLLARKRAGA